MKHEKGTEGEITLVCHVTKRSTGVGSPFLAEGQTGLGKPQVNNVLTSTLMFSSNSDEKTQAATRNVQNVQYILCLPLMYTLTEGNGSHGGVVIL